MMKLNNMNLDIFHYYNYVNSISFFNLLFDNISPKIILKYLFKLLIFKILFKYNNKLL